MAFIPKLIISGGQTGVDRAALDAAMNLGLQTGGWCPRGRRAEDGIIPEKYPLQETNSPHNAVRTGQNVYESDATLILTRRALTAGTALTVSIAERLERPFIVLHPGDEHSLEEARNWLERTQPSVLNVAGPRHSEDEEIEILTKDWITRLFSV